jgi:hypothetical protein
MDLEDYAEPEVGIAVAAVGLLFSPQVRRLVRRGAVYGLSGVLIASKTIGSTLQRAKPGSQPASTSSFMQELAQEAQMIKAQRSTATPAHEQ